MFVCSQQANHLSFGFESFNWLNKVKHLLQRLTAGRLKFQKEEEHPFILLVARGQSFKIRQNSAESASVVRPAGCRVKAGTSAAASS